MAPSRYLAGLIGPTMLAIAVMVMLNRARLPAMLAGPDGALVVLVTGAMSFVAGLAILRAHFVWRGWPILVSLVGCLAVIGGLARLWWPDCVIALARFAIASPPTVPIAAAVLAALGLFLSWQGYRPRPPESPR
jgi:hypothetical protein